ncbi:MAG: AAA family ATPase [Actinomycetota bacterium]
MQALRVVTLAGDSEREADIAALFAGEPSVELFMRCVDRVELLATMRGAELDAIVAVGAPGWFDAQSAQEAARAGIRVVGVADNAFEAELLTSRGAQVLDASSEMGAIVSACRAPVPTVSPPATVDVPQRAGEVIVVWGPKGSPGRTVIAIELACELASTGEETLLVDADPYAGDISQMLGIVEELPTVLWGATAASGNGVTSREIISELRRVGNKGPLLLPGLPRAELWSEVSNFGYGNLIKLLAGGARFVVVDIGFCLEDVSHFGSSRSGRNRMARATLERADRLIAVCRADPVGLKNFIWAYESLREVVDEDRISIVLNRSYPSERREIDDLLEGNTGKRSTVAVPDRPSDCRKALAQGGALFEVRPASDVCTHTRLLAEKLGARVRPRGLMARLAGRS